MYAAALSCLITLKTQQADEYWDILNTPAEQIESIRLQINDPTFDTFTNVNIYITFCLTFCTGYWLILEFAGGLVGWLCQGF